MTEANSRLSEASAFQSKSYSRHAEHYAQFFTDQLEIKRSQSWFDKTTADYWRHARMYECAECLKSEPDASWLTIGDGRFGLDSIRLREKGFSNVLPTDISKVLLDAAKERGLIKEYAVENAERLSFEDNAFDYILCKESFHHFPRPYLALYEMLRVARKAVFLIEPNEKHIRYPLAIDLSKSLLKSLLTDVPLGIVKRLRGKRAPVRISTKANSGGLLRTPDWEHSGNYEYSFSRYEAEKVALGLNLPQIAVKGINDCYVDGCEFERADIERSAIFRTIVQTIEEMDALCIEGLQDYSVLMVSFFLEPMGHSTVRSEFSARGWTIVDLPRNPFITTQ